MSGMTVTAKILSTVLHFSFTPCIPSIFSKTGKFKETWHYINFFNLPRQLDLMKYDFFGLSELPTNPNSVDLGKNRQTSQPTLTLYTFTYLVNLSRKQCHQMICRRVTVSLYTESQDFKETYEGVKFILSTHRLFDLLTEPLLD